MNLFKLILYKKMFEYYIYLVFIEIFRFYAMLSMKILKLIVSVLIPNTIKIQYKINVTLVKYKLSYKDL